MSISGITNKIYQANNAWHNLTETNDELLKDDANNADPLILSKLNKLNEFIDKQQKEINSLKAVISRPMAEKNPKTTENDKDVLEYKSAFCNYVRKGVQHNLSNLEYKSSLANNDSEFGYSITNRMAEQLFDLLIDSSIMRKIAKVTEVSTDALELIEDRGETDAGWSKDADKIINDGGAVNPSRKLILVHELYAQPRITQKLLDDPRIDAEEWIMKKLIDIFAKKENHAFINGDGDGKPRGILSYQSGKEWGKIEQITTTKKGEITAESIMNLFFSLKAIYAPNAKFLMSRSAIQAIRMLKDEKSGRYLWSPSVSVETPNTILGAEVIESSDMPEVKENNLSVAFADFKLAYQIVDRSGMNFLRDPYTGKPYVKYYALKRVGGDVVNFDAIKLLKIA